MARRTKPEKISERHWQGSQSWNFQRVTRLEDGQTIRTTIKRDAYDDQSYGKVERWDGEKWRGVVRVPLSELPLSCNAYLTPASVEATRFYPAAELIEAEAVAIITPDRRTI